MEWISILEVLAVTMAASATMLMLLILMQFARRIMPSIPQKVMVMPKHQKEEKEKTKMSKEASEGITFNDIFMFMIAVPLVLLWVGFAGFVIHTGLNNSSVLENIEAYTTLIAILGGPALLIIKDALDVWKQEQAEKTAFYKVKAQAVIDFNDANQKQAQMIESKAQEQEHKMESKK
jgi:sterol desaturase/sphingolipid hydroxylase (fatty acid hydroxylase superfamily)|tara:strand:- start:944 stop:1474 length:531 start_codon:yes stop_codon:yes gene_type:complete